VCACVFVVSALTVNLRNDMQIGINSSPIVRPFASPRTPACQQIN